MPSGTAAPRGRYAPSPTGEIHLGNAATALFAWLSVRAAGGALVLRVEDLDRPRVRPGATERILADLAWLGLDWDEGPDRGGPRGPYEQSRRGAAYEAAFERLRGAGRVYPCFCSRRDVAVSASAPQEPGDELRYPGTCRDLAPEEAERRLEAGRPFAFRFRVGEDDDPAFDDRVLGRTRLGTPGDFVVRRADGTPAYQLAVVVDDAAMGITEVVRGGDLLASTPRQILLYRTLGLAPPAFGHVPLVLGPDGARLSKRHAGSSIAEMRNAGLSPERVVGWIARVTGIRGDDRPIAARDLVDGFSLGRLSASSPAVRLAALRPR